MGQMLSGSTGHRGAQSTFPFSCPISRTRPLKASEEAKRSSDGLLHVAMHSQWSWSGGQGSNCAGTTCRREVVPSQKRGGVALLQLTRVDVKDVVARWGRRRRTTIHNQMMLNTYSSELSLRRRNPTDAVLLIVM